MNLMLIFIRIALLLFSCLPVSFSIVLYIWYRKVRDSQPLSVPDSAMIADSSTAPYYRAADTLFASCFYTIPVGIILVVALLYTLQRRQSTVNRVVAAIYLCSILYLFGYLITAGKELTFYFD